MTLRKEGMNFRNYFLPEANYAICRHKFKKYDSKFSFLISLNDDDGKTITRH